MSRELGGRGAAVQMLATRKTNQHIEDFSWNDTKSKPPETMREQCIRNTSIDAIQPQAS